MHLTILHDDPWHVLIQHKFSKQSAIKSKWNTNVQGRLAILDPDTDQRHSQGSPSGNPQVFPTKPSSVIGSTLARIVRGPGSVPGWGLGNAGLRFRSFRSLCSFKNAKRSFVLKRTGLRPKCSLFCLDQGLVGLISDQTLSL